MHSRSLRRKTNSRLYDDNSIYRPTYPAIKCKCTFLNLYSVAQGRCTVIRNSTFDSKLPAILYKTTFDSLVKIFTFFIDFFCHGEITHPEMSAAWLLVYQTRKIWLIKHSGGRGATALRCLFVHRYNLSNHHPVPHKNAFGQLVQRFNATGGVTGINQGKTLIAVTLKNIARVQAFFEENPTKSITSAAHELDTSFGLIWFFFHLGPHSIRIKKPSASSRGPRRSCDGPPWMATQCWPFAGWIIAPAQ